MNAIFRIGLVVLAFLILISAWGFYISIRPPKINSSITPRALNLQYENVSFKTADDLRAAASDVLGRPRSTTSRDRSRDRRWIVQVVGD